MGLSISDSPTLFRYTTYTHTIICKTNKTTKVVGLYSAMAIETKQKREALTSLYGVPPGNIYIAVMLCTSIYLALMQVKWSRFARGLNSPFYTTLKRSYFTSPKIMIFALRDADMLGYNCVATEPIYQTLYIASYQAERHKTAFHHHGTVAACVW